MTGVVENAQCWLNSISGQVKSPLSSKREELD